MKVEAFPIPFNTLKMLKDAQAKLNGYISCDWLECPKQASVMFSDEEGMCSEHYREYQEEQEEQRIIREDMYS